MAWQGRRCIGVYVNWPDAGPYQRAFLRGIHREGQIRDAHILVFGIGNLQEDPAQDAPGSLLLNYISSGVLDGVIFLTGSFSPEAGQPRKNSLVPPEPHLPMISVGDLIEGIPNILLDNKAGFDGLLDHLFADHRYRRPVFVAGPPHSWDSQERLRCFQRALERHRLTYSDDLVYYGNFTFHAGAEAVRVLQQGRGLNPDVYICANDSMAIGVRQALRSGQVDGKKLPAVTGFDDIPVSAWFESPLTTVHQPLEQSGRLAMELLYELFAGKTIEPRRSAATVPVFRSSCGCARPVDPHSERTLATVENEVLEALVNEDKARSDDNRMGSFAMEFLANRRIDGHHASEEEVLGRIGGGNFLLTLFDDPEVGLEGSSRLMIAWQNGRRHELPEGGMPFATQELLPALPNSAQATTLLITVLDNARENLGILMVEYGISADLLERLRNYLAETIVAVTQADRLERLYQELKAAKLRMEQLSQTDELTGHYNRRGFLSMALRLAAFCRRQKEGFWVLYLDLDGLKTINDTYGHDDGDLAIRSLGTVLRKSFRATDVVARLGGDEFTVLAANAQPNTLDVFRQRVDEVMQAINDDLSKPWQLQVSLGGYYSDPDSLESLEEMMLRADKELYKQKRERKQRSPSTNS